jgi:hypothetical protein
MMPAVGMLLSHFNRMPTGALIANHKACEERGCGIMTRWFDFLFCDV